MVRANGSYPLCPGFNSLHRHHPLLKRFRRDLKAFALRDGHRVLLAVSGGGDSLGLLALFLSAQPRPALTLGVAHIHHNLRGKEADRDEAFVKEMALALGLPSCSAKLADKPAKGESVEAWAREHRYPALERLRTQGGWDRVATAHTLDDQAETVLMRIARGTGPQGLAGILPVSGRVIRPSLGFTGEELRLAATTCGLAWVEDSTNLDRRYLRNHIRREILPVLENALPGFSRKLAALARLAALDRVVHPTDVARIEGDAVYYERDALSGLAVGLTLDLFKEGLRTVRGDLKRISERHLRALLALVDARPGGTVALPDRWVGIRERGGIRIRRAKEGEGRSR